MKTRSTTLAISAALLLSALPPLSRLTAAAPGAPGQLLNISTRLPVQTGDNALIGGFIVTGNAPKRVIIRGLGPSLAAFFDGALQDPTLQLFQGNTLLASNDNWREAEAEVQATGIPPTNDHESAIVRTLAPGAYTAVLRGKGDTTGIALVEAYDLDQAADSKLANISTRGFIDTGNNVMIGGVIVGPSDAGSTYVIVRAIGPSLASANISNPLQDPTLDLVDQNGATVRSDDNWKDSQAADIEGTGLQPTDPRESTLIAPLQPGVYTAIVRGVGGTTGVGVVEVYEVGGSLPAPLPVLDPISQAPPPPADSIPSFDDQTGFLYKGSNPIQRGVAPGTILPTAAAVVRGIVKTRDDQPLAGVRISVLAHPEYGYTLSRADGQYDIALNGGEVEHISYELSGYFPAQREVQLRQQDFAKAAEVVLVAADPIATTLVMGPDAPVQMANSSMQSDAAGSRSATMFFPQGTGAKLLFPGGTSQSVDKLTVRATEYTVGPKGPAAMPAALPGTSQYTYCAELSADEAVAAGAKSILFDKPVAVYLENFLSIPVGAYIPNGYYDREKAAWVPQENGIVMKVMSTTDGVANLDFTGDDVAESEDVLAANGVTVDERRQIATRFAVGQTFWRAPLTHFTGVDLNCPPTTDPRDKPPGDKSNSAQPSGNPNDNGNGFGELGLASQVFKEELPLAGTGVSLHYASDRVPGYRVNGALDLSLIGDKPPTALVHTEFEVSVAGQTTSQDLKPAANLAGNFQWDGRDAYHPQSADGRAFFGGSALARITLRYFYPLYYGGHALYQNSLAKYAPFFGLPGRVASGIFHAGVEEGIQSTFSRILTIPDHRKLGLGGWSLTPHHFYDVVAKILYRGDGTQVKVQSKGRLEVLYRGSPTPIYRTQVALNAKGEAYFVASYNGLQIFKRKVDGTVVPVTRGVNVEPKISVTSHDLDGKLAADVSLDSGPNDMRSGPDGSIYFGYFFSIWRLDKDDRFHLVLCGSRDDQINNGGVPDGAYANDSYRYPEYTGNRIAVARDGSVYFTDVKYATDGRAVFMIRKIAPDGRIYTIAGLGGQPKNIDAYTAGDAYGDLDMGTPALTARLRLPESLAVGPDDSVFYASGNFGINRIKPNGILERIVLTSPQTAAGRPEGSPSDEGKPGADSGAHDFGRAGGEAYLSVAPDGTLYFFARGAYTPPSIWQVGSDNLLQRVAGGWFPLADRSGSPLDLNLGDNVISFAFSPDGSIIIADDYSGGGGGDSDLRRISPALPGFTGEELTVASEDGTEQYIFDAHGRHLRTVDPLLNVVKWTFNYDQRGFVTSLHDRDGLVTTVQRDSAGNATAVVGPYGITTQLGLDANGYLASITAPDTTKTQITNSAGGLLQSITGPRQDTYSFVYDEMGRLTRGNQPTGGFTQLSRSGSTKDATFTATTALGRSETRQVTQTPVGGTRITRTSSSETPEIEDDRPDGSIVLDDSPISVEQIYRSSDPRPTFAGQATYPSSLKITIPNGPEATITSTEQATISNPDDPSSLTMFVRKTSLNGNQSSDTYDAPTRTRTFRSPEARTSTIQFSAKGRPSRGRLGDLEAVTLSYDSLGRPSIVSSGAAGNLRTSMFGYDSNGYMNLVRAADGRETRTNNDAFGRPVSILLPGERNVSLSYGVDGRIASITPPDRPAYIFGYDPATGTSTYQAPAIPGVDNVTVIEQNLEGRLRSVKLPGGRAVNITYDSTGRIATTKDTFGDSFAYTYSPSGQIASISLDGGNSVALSHIGDKVSNLVWSGDISGSIARQFNNDFRPSSEAVNGSVPVSFAYNADGLLSTAGALSVTWRPDKALPAGAAIGLVNTSFDYNEFGEFVGATSSSNGMPLLSVSDNLDQEGRIAGNTTTVLGGNPIISSYTYNGAGFLASVRINDSIISKYTYDVNGNITNATTAAGDTSYAYDSQDRLERAGTTTFVYTDAGELEARVGPEGRTTYTYDELGQLRRVALADGRVVAYESGALGGRIGKKVNGLVVQAFLRDNRGTILAELSQSNAVVNRFVYASRSGAPAFLIRGSDTFRILTDSLGSVRLVVNVDSGNVAQRIDYDEWGAVTFDSSPGFQPFGFAGGLYDPDTKLVRFGARDYDPSVRRWTAPDPLRFRGGTTNLYSYVSNDPVNTIDPLGTGPGALLADAGAIDVNVDRPHHHQPGPIVDPPAGSTTGLGLGGSFLIAVIGGTGSLQAVADDDGNVGLAFQWGVAVGAGADVKAAFQVADTKGTIYDLRGPSSGGGLNGGLGIAGGRDLAYNPDGTYLGETRNFGVGLGVEAHVQLTQTHVAGFNPSRTYNAVRNYFGY